MATKLTLRGISKAFHSVQALKNVSLEFLGGEIHVLIGENGAGKSTAMKIVAGLYKQDEGTIELDGETLRLSTPLDAIGHGISMIHQELLPVPYLTVAENIFLGREPRTGLKTLDKKKIIRQTEELFASMGVELDPRAEMRTLSVAQIQLVEIAKAVSFNAGVLIMDEPTSAISDKEIERLYDLVFRLKAEGKAIVFISHKLDEIFHVADKISVLRDGEYIGTKPAAELTRDELIAMMIGRDISNIYNKTPAVIGPPVLEVRGLTVKGLFEDISFTLRQNEILGIAGLMGAGRTELVETIFGLRRADAGEVLVNGVPVRIKTPSDAQANGIAMIPEDRKLLGLNLKGTTGENISLCVLKEFEKALWLDKKAENSRVDAMIAEMAVKVPGRKTPVISLSGGNQQKVVIAKWMMTAPEILIMDEPTRGIDIGAKTEIYKLLNGLANSGKSVIMVSSELPEIIGLSDRVLVLAEGRLTGELVGEKITQQNIMRRATATRQTGEDEAG